MPRCERSGIAGGRRTLDEQLSSLKGRNVEDNERRNMNYYPPKKGGVRVSCEAAPRGLTYLQPEALADSPAANDEQMEKDPLAKTLPVLDTNIDSGRLGDICPFETDAP